MAAAPRILFTEERLPGGGPVLISRIPGRRSLGVGVYVPVGSRHERPQQQGLAHFIEHMVFKGTRRYSARQLLRKIEGAGAEINAFTARDHMFFYIHGIDQHGKTAIDVLHEMLFQPVFPEPELEKERNVILEEIEMYKDSPEDDITDRFFELLFPGHPLGADILGKPEQIRQYGRSDLMQFHAAHIHPFQAIYSISGGLSFSRVSRWLEKAAGAEAPTTKKETLAAPPPPIGVVFEQERRKDFHQTHVVVGLSLPAFGFEDRIRLAAVSQYLGGNMRSVLWEELREKRGCVYHVSTQVQFFQDASVFYIHFGTTEKHLSTAMKTVRRLLKKLFERPVARGRLAEVRRQLLTAAVWGAENVAHQIFMQAWQRHHYGHAVPLEVRMAALEALTPARLFAFSQTHLHPDRYAALIYHARS